MNRVPVLSSIEAPESNSSQLLMAIILWGTSSSEFDHTDFLAINTALSTAPPRPPPLPAPIPVDHSSNGSSIMAPSLSPSTSTTYYSSYYATMASASSVAPAVVNRHDSAVNVPVVAYSSQDTSVVAPSLVTYTSPVGNVAAAPYQHQASCNNYGGYSAQNVPSVQGPPAAHQEWRGSNPAMPYYHPNNMGYMQEQFAGGYNGTYPGAQYIDYRSSMAYDGNYTGAHWQH